MQGTSRTTGTTESKYNSNSSVQLFPYLLERVDTLAFGVEGVLFVKISDCFWDGAGNSCASQLR
jgi:hypothetical protein